MRRTFEGGILKSNDEERSVTAIVSAQIRDAEGEIIKVGTTDTDGIVLTRYRTNPILLLQHDMNFPIGKAVVMQKREGVLAMKFKLSTVTKAAVETYNLLKSGVLKAFSVRFGFDRKDYDEKNKIHRKTELFEVSVVSVPSNMAALAVEVKSGRLSDHTLMKSLNAPAYMREVASEFGRGQISSAVLRERISEEEERDIEARVNKAIIKNFNEIFRKVISERIQTEFDRNFTGKVY